jgi:hypothetical protein
MVTSAAGAQTYQNAQLYVQSKYIDLSTTNKVVTVDVYSMLLLACAKVVDGKSGPSQLRKLLIQ